MTSTHKAEVVPVVLTKHPNADSLSVVHVWGYTCCVRTEDWACPRDKGCPGWYIGVVDVEMDREGPVTCPQCKRAAYIVPDTVVDTKRPEFAFLAPDAKPDGTYRVRAKKLRGVWSQGLLVPTTEPLGSDLYADLGLSRYEPGTGGNPRSKTDRWAIGGEEDREPPIHTGPAKYDVEAFERYHDSLTPGEEVFVSEKLDGTNVRAVWWGGRLYVKSRNRWPKRVPDYSHVTRETLLANGCPEEKIGGILAGLEQKKGRVNDYWKWIEEAPGLVEYLKANPGTTVYGEVYGTTNRIRYGENRFAAFDVYRGMRFLDFPEAMGELQDAGVPTVVSWSDPYTRAGVEEVREGPTFDRSAPKGTIREGVVIRPRHERTVPHLGRLILKAVNPAFHELKT